MPTIEQLINHYPQPGRVARIGLRREKRGPVESVARVEADPKQGLVGDRYQGRSGRRQVTLVQQEHLAVIAALLGSDKLDPQMLRRNLVIAGINLLALKGRRFRLGQALLEYTGPCHPCSRMEEALGEGGYNAMRGHGGITARVIEGGLIAVGDSLTVT